MRFYQLLNFQHVVLFVCSTLVFVVILGLSLAESHWHSKNAEIRKQRVYYRYPDDIEDKNAPFPFFMTLIIAGTVFWGIFYILGSGLLGVKI